LATPVAIMVGNGVGAKNGILFKTGESLEEAGKTEIIALDKTGTITSGEPKVTELVPVSGITEEELLKTAFSLEKNSEHPLGKAVVSEGEKRGLVYEEAEEFTALPGNGLRAKIKGKSVTGGSGAYIRGLTEVPAELAEKEKLLSSQGKTPLFFAEDGKLLGIISVADTIKPDSAEGIRELKNLGLRVVMLTGDNEGTAAAIGKEAGVDEWIAGVLPDGKEEVIKKLKQSGKTAMVGDGINDAPALTRADIGIAIGAGTDVAIDSADIVLMNSTLTDVAAAIRLSRRTLVNIHENLFWAFFYNVICIPLAAGLFAWKMNPMFGAAAMSLSSFTVCMNALRINRVKVHDTSRDRKIHSKQNTNNKERKQEMENTKTIKIEGMMCAHCEATVKKALEELPFIEEAKASHEDANAVLTLSGEFDETAVKGAVEGKDYKYLGTV
ncbi:MAG: heavy metal translocating P-type ATPase, partial [Lachnospiraceae bacterium]|nr:heavy metal translocating P-type ATPase [Lachnospiraceae bacterium]